MRDCSALARAEVLDDKPPAEEGVRGLEGVARLADTRRSVAK